MNEQEPFFGGLLSFKVDEGEIVSASGVDVNLEGGYRKFELEKEDRLDSRPPDTADRINAGMVGVAYTGDWYEDRELNSIFSVWADFNSGEWWTEDEGEMEQ